MFGLDIHRCSVAIKASSDPLHSVTCAEQNTCAKALRLALACVLDHPIISGKL